MSEFDQLITSQPTEEILHTQAVTALAGAINTELKLTVLWSASAHGSDDYVTRFSTKDFLAEHGVDTSSKSGTSAGHLGLILDRLAQKGLLEGDAQDGYRRSLLGTIALGFGGPIFDTGFRNNVPIKTLIGEDGQAERADGSVKDGIESRLALWLELFTTEQKAWLPVPEILARTDEKYGMQENGVRHALSTLTKAGAVEVRQSQSRKTKRPYKEARIRSVEGTNYREAIADYFGAIGAVATMDQRALANGIETIQKSMNYVLSESLLPLLVRRTHVTTPRHGIAAVRQRKKTD